MTMNFYAADSLVREDVLRTLPSEKNRILSTGRNLKLGPSSSAVLAADPSPNSLAHPQTRLWLLAGDSEMLTLSPRFLVPTSVTLVFRGMTISWIPSKKY